MSLPAWQSRDPRSLQRDRWRRIAAAEAEAAWDAGEEHIARAFELVSTTVELDATPAPPVHGRDVLKGRAAIRDQAIRLAGTGLSARAVARLVGQPYLTVYTWLRKAGVAPTRAAWRESVRRPRAA